MNTLKYTSSLLGLLALKWVDQPASNQLFSWTILYEQSLYEIAAQALVRILVKYTENVIDQAGSGINIYTIQCKWYECALPRNRCMITV